MESLKEHGELKQAGPNEKVQNDLPRPTEVPEGADGSISQRTGKGLLR